MLVKHSLIGTVGLSQLRAGCVSFEVLANVIEDHLQASSMSPSVRGWCFSGSRLGFVLGMQDSGEAMTGPATGPRRNGRAWGPKEDRPKPAYAFIGLSCQVILNSHF